MFCGWVCNNVGIVWYMKPANFPLCVRNTQRKDGEGCDLGRDESGCRVELLNRTYVVGIPRMVGNRPQTINTCTTLSEFMEPLWGERSPGKRKNRRGDQNLRAKLYKSVGRGFRMPMGLSGGSKLDMRNRN